MSDAQLYRSKNEVAEYQKVDPILIVKKILEKKKWSSPDELEAITKRVKSVVAECVKFAEDSPYPESHELWQDVYVQSD